MIYNRGFFGRSALILSLAALCGGALIADEIYLKDGRIIDGEITSKNDAEIVDIRVSVNGLKAVQHFPKQQIYRITYRVSAHQELMDFLQHEYDVLAQRTDASANDWWNLANKLSKNGVGALAKDAAVQTVNRDRQHPEARRMLGMTLSHGVWMRANEMAIARGEVYFRGAWVPWRTQEQTLNDEAKAKEEQLAARKERDEQRRQARIAAASATPVFAETYVNNYYRSPYYNPYRSWSYFGGSGCSIMGTYPMGGVSYSNSQYSTGGGINWHIGATGGGSNNAWAFNWNGGSTSNLNYR